MAQVTIRQALQQVADYPVSVDDDALNAPAHELLARVLFDIANRPDQSVRGSMARANKARAVILNRMAGKRRTGTRPVRPQKQEVKILDLTTEGEISV